MDYLLVNYNNTLWIKRSTRYFIVSDIYILVHKVFSIEQRNNPQK
jgi:hypothetical protein